MFTIVLIGSTNVGKTSLFNKLTCTNYALNTKVSNFTFDFNYGIVSFKKKIFICIDTSGLSDFNFLLKNKNNRKYSNTELIIHKNFFYVINNVNLICLLIDGSIRLTSNDLFLSKFFFKFSKKKFVILISKIDLCKDFYLYNYYSLGVNNIIYPISVFREESIFNFLNDIFFKKNFFKNFSDFYKRIFKFCVNLCDYSYLFKNKEKNFSFDIIKIIILGKPNVGKSTFFNCIIKNYRSIVSSVSGTTKDLIMYNLNIRNINYLISDTPGILKYSNFNLKENSFFLKKIFDFKIVLYLIDINIGITKYDLFLLNLLFNKGKLLVLIFNKCEKISSLKKRKYKKYLLNKYDFIKYIDIYFISSLNISNRKINLLFNNISNNYRRFFLFNFSSSLLTKILNKAVNSYFKKNNFNNFIKLKYAHLGGYYPLVIVIHGNKINLINNSYKKYLINFYISKLNIRGIKIYLKFKEISNFFLK